MKTKTTDPRVHESLPLQRFQKEHSHGGTATFEDNRPSSIHQLKRQEGIDAQMDQSTNPIQRKAPKGSSRFQNIAMDMGEKYGVDTSGLTAIHNSSFPKKLNAEAMIQGSNIYFAPRQDTDYNIRHEVAHAIDNSINGMPKGNMVVNGQHIDTTREKVVDQMAKGAPMPVQGKASAFPLNMSDGNSEPFQLVDGSNTELSTELNEEGFNVVGEIHFESNDRRNAEEQLSREVFGKDSYWMESLFTVKNNAGEELYADPQEYQLQYCLFKVMEDLYVIQDPSIWDSLTRENYSDKVAVIIRKYKIMGQYFNVIRYRFGHLIERFGIAKEVNILSDLLCNQLKADLVDIRDKGLMFKADPEKRLKIRIDASLFQAWKIAEVLGFEVKDKSLDTCDINLFRITKRRSKVMHRVLNIAGKKGTKGILKVGQEHVDDFIRIGEKSKFEQHYTLINRDDFNKKYFPKTENESIPKKRFRFFKLF